MHFFFGKQLHDTEERYAKRENQKTEFFELSQEKIPEDLIEEFVVFENKRFKTEKNCFCVFF
jgi:hypothetical protein